MVVMFGTDTRLPWIQRLMTSVAGADNDEVIFAQHSRQCGVCLVSIAGRHQRDLLKTARPDRRPLKCL